MLDTRPLLLATDFPPIRRLGVETLQVNLGYLCNLSCTHCHVNSGPTRTELMDFDTIELVLDYLKVRDIHTLDLTGGAPEMNPHFKFLVEEARKLGVDVIDRCNLTILGEPGYEDLAEFLANQRVIVTASLPCYTEQNVERQRGKGVFEDSIIALKCLNELGYGRRSELQLNLVYNPDGVNLPPGQQTLEKEYKKELGETYGIVFNQLFTITNMPISRFGGMLLSKGLYQQYMGLLRENYRPENLKTVMCRTLISVDYQGYVYDCDFNQMLQLPLTLADSTATISLAAELLASDKEGLNRAKPHLSQLLDSELNDEIITVGEHCYGCTAGQGSSCGGALGE